MKYKLSYLDNLPSGIGGQCKYPIIPLVGTCKIVIRPKYENDNGILAHELKHCEQYSKHFFHAIKYNLIASYKYKCELEAYTEQIRAYGYTELSQCSWIVDALMFKYSLNLKRSSVELDILKILNDVLRTK